ncbi:MAG: translational GTPase TypA [Clostridia bacterium]|nr:translational GTPase TypA [Clostridia bacterium]
MNNQKIRNIAIIAHVDHGKTTLVDSLLKQSHIFRDNEQVQERIMDSNDLEKERGITILSKNTSVMYKDIKINIVDTPGHADFGGEVERVLKTVDGVLLLVDSFEGAMPQTREVLKKALALDLKPIVVINKIDRPGARPEKVVDEVIELFIELDATDEQLEFPVVYASAKNGTSKLSMADDDQDMTPLFETIINTIQAPNCDEEGPAQMLVSNIDYDDYVGRIAVGRVERGTFTLGMPVSICKDEKVVQGKVAKIYTHVGLKKEEVEEAKAGDIIEIAGIADISIGDTICDLNSPEKIPFVNIDEPTVSMTFSVNNGPLAGREGQFVTSRHIRDRLFKELERNVSLRVKEGDTADSFEVSGRGELHLAVLIETMRREGFELLVSRPKVIIKEIDGVKCEPVESLVVNVPDDSVGTVIEKLGRRKGEMVNMEPAEDGHTKIEFNIPARGLIGYRTEFLTDTKGEGTMASIFKGYEPFKGEVVARVRGTIVAFEAGKSITYGLYNAQEKGDLFIGPGVEVYEGMIVGLNSRGEDLAVNVCKEKHLTNTRSSGSDEALHLVPPMQMSLEKAIEFIQDDELVEITPESIRLRKKILNNKERERAARNSK